MQLKLYIRCIITDFLYFVKSKWQFLRLFLENEKSRRDITSHPLDCLALFTATATAATFATLLFSVLCTARTPSGTAYTFLTALFRFNHVENGSANDQDDCRYGNQFTRLHTYTSLSALFFLIINQASNAATASTIHQPTIGIHTAPKSAPVNNVPKKKTRKLRI